MAGLPSIVARVRDRHPAEQPDLTDRLGELIRTDDLPKSTRQACDARVVLVLLPHDPLRPRAVDPHFLPDRSAALELGVHVALVDHDAISRGTAGAPRVTGPDGDPTDAVYRGWMIPSDRYAAWERELARHGIALRTDAAAYRRAHELPGWYAALAHLTPATEWSTDDSRSGFDEASARLAAVHAR